MAANPDSEALFERLTDAGVIVETDEQVRLTAEFASTLDIVRATYADSSDEQFHDAVAETFDLSQSEAQAQIETHGVTREEFCILKSVQRYLEDATPETLLRSVGMVAAAEDSPIPASMDELDADFEQALAGRDAVVFVFKRGCRPCDNLKADLDGIRSTVPSHVSFFGVDGSEVAALREAYDVTVAPTALFFTDGEFQTRLEGYDSPDRFETTATKLY